MANETCRQIHLRYTMCHRHRLPNDEDDDICRSRRIRWGFRGLNGKDRACEVLWMPGPTARAILEMKPFTELWRVCGESVVLSKSVGGVK